MIQPSPARSPIFPLLLLLALVMGTTAGIATRFFVRHGGTHTGPFGPLLEPRAQFDFKDRVNILVMGIDDNWTKQDIVYTKGARTDTLFVVSLDMESRKAYLLSIPRDSRVRIAGTRHWGKINGAYATGGPARARATVEGFLGVPIDKYVVLKIDATRNLVDTIGGVDLNVEKDMKYDDNWGHLHINLQKGMQHLNGEQAVGYVRFRHDRDGDFGRIRRQQQLLHTIAGKLKSPMMLPRLPDIMSNFRQSVQTDLTNEQLLALANLFRGVNPSQIITSYVPGTDQRVGGIWFLVPDEDRKKLVVDWLMKGNADAQIPLVKVAVENGCGSEPAAISVRDKLQQLGFEAYLDGNADRTDYANSQVIDYDRLRGSGALVAARLGLSVQPLVQPDPQADTHVVVIVGRDLASATLASRASHS